MWNGSAWQAASVVGGTVNTIAVNTSATLNYGTANGVAYLNGSKVLTTGSALTFDGTNLLNSGALRLTGGASSNVRFEAGGSEYARIMGNGSNSLDFAVGGTTPNMSLTSTGLGIGTSSPSTKLDVVTASGNSQLRVSNGTYYGYFGIDGGYAGLDYAAPSGGHRFRIGGSFTTAMTLDASGNLLVGTTSGDARLYVVSSSTNNNTGTLYALNTNTTADACVAAFATATNSTATSNVLIKFGINSYSNGSGQINANGSGAAAFGSFSDRRLKENIVDLPSQLNNICALRPVEFDYIESEGGGHQIGFIAQEMQEVYPDAVGERGDGMLTVTGWDKTAARLVAAIQEQQAIIEQLKARLDAANL